MNQGVKVLYLREVENPNDDYYMFERYECVVLNESTDKLYLPTTDIMSHEGIKEAALRIIEDCILNVDENCKLIPVYSAISHGVYYTTLAYIDRRKTDLIINNDGLDIKAEFINLSNIHRNKCNIFASYYSGLIENFGNIIKCIAPTKNVDENEYGELQVRSITPDIDENKLYRHFDLNPKPKTNVVAQVTASIAEGYLGRYVLTDEVKSMCEAIISNKDVWPIDKLSRWLGYVQGVLICNNYTTVEIERAASRPLFHMAYKMEGIKIPPSCSVNHNISNATREMKNGN